MIDRRELLTILAGSTVLYPFTKIRFAPKANTGPSEEARYGPRDSDDAVYDSWLDDYSKDDHHLG